MVILFSQGVQAYAGAVLSRLILRAEDSGPVSDDCEDHERQLAVEHA